MVGKTIKIRGTAIGDVETTTGCNADAGESDLQEPLITGLNFARPPTS